jgi:hypothetical protein
MLKTGFVYAAIGLLAACGTASPAPSGWQPIAGTSTGWTSGTGSSAETYRFAKRSFGGTLQDLASQEAINVVMRYVGAKLQSSDPFGPCPGMAAVASFRLGTSKLLAQGFAVQNGQAVQTTYIRPVGKPVDRAVAQAMQRTLCRAPI